MSVSKPFYNDWISQGISMEVPDLISTSDLRGLWPLVKQSLGGNWGFIEISESQFVDTFKAALNEPGDLKLMLVKEGEEVIGFCRFVEEDSQTIIVKTIGILPAYQGKGLGNAMAYKLHESIVERGYQTALYALIFEGNRVNRMPRDTAEFFRRYKTFEYDLD
jgi:RimJ/RimL family protein N-acetyltransferase